MRFTSNLLTCRTEWPSRADLGQTSIAVEAHTIIGHPILLVVANTILMKLSFPVEDILQELGGIVQDVLNGVQLREPAFGVSGCLSVDALQEQ